MKISHLITDFSGGAVSPMLAGRVDSALYQRGVAEMKNAFPNEFGGVLNDPPTYLVDGNSGGVATNLLVPFSIDNGDAFCLNFVYDTSGSTVKLIRIAADGTVSASYDTDTGAQVDAVAARGAYVSHQLLYNPTTEAWEIWFVHPDFEPVKVTFTPQSIQPSGSALDVSATHGGTFGMSALTATRIAVASSGDDKISTYDWSGSAWSLVGNAAAITGRTYVQVAAMSSTRVAMIDGTGSSGLYTLETWDFDGTNWTSVGNTLDLSAGFEGGGLTYPAITALSSTRVVIHNKNEARVAAFDFDGTDWTQVGNSYLYSYNGYQARPPIAAISSTEIVIAGDKMATLTFDGTDFSQTSALTELNNVAAGPSSLTKLSATRVAYAMYGSTSGNIQIYDLDGDFWSPVGEEYPEGNTLSAIAGLDSDTFVFIDAAEELQTYDFVAASIAASAITFTSDPFSTLGYPGAITLFGGRVVFGGFSDAPTTIYGSQVGTYENLDKGTDLDDEAYEFALASSGVASIAWLLGVNDSIVVGTTQNEIIVHGNGSPITPTNIAAYEQTGFGSEKSVQPIRLGSTLAFIESGGRKIRQYVYQNETQAYQSPELTRFTSHIFTGKIVKWGLMNKPITCLWCLLDTGDIIGLSYQGATGATAVHRHTCPQGYYSNLAVIQASGDENDVLVAEAVLDNDYAVIVRFGDFPLQRENTTEYSDRSALWGCPAPTNQLGVSRDAISSITLAATATLTRSTNTAPTGSKFRIVNCTRVAELDDNEYYLTNVADNGDGTYTYDIYDPDTETAIDMSGYTDLGSGYSYGDLVPVTKTIDDLAANDWLDGLDVTVLVDSGVEALDSYDPSTDTEVSDWTAVMSIGLLQTGYVKTLPLTPALQLSGPGIYIDRFVRILARCLHTSALKVGLYGELISALPFQDSADPAGWDAGTVEFLGTSTQRYGYGVEPLTGEFTSEVASAFRNDQEIVIQMDSGHRACVLHLIADLEVSKG